MPTRGAAWGLCRMLVAGLFVLPLTLPTAADEIHLIGGGVIVVEDWWLDGDTLFYETDAGTIGIPRSDILDVRSIDGQRAPSFSTPEPEAETRNEVAPGTLEKHDELIAMLERERRWESSSDRQDVITQRLADMYVIRARNFVGLRNWDAARNDYERAVALIHTHRVGSIELSWLLIRQNEIRSAGDLIERMAVVYPKDADVLTVVGEVAYRENRLNDALEAYAEALELRPDDPTLIARAEKLARELEVQRKYRDVLSNHFVVRFDGKRDDTVGREVAELLERAWPRLTRELNVYPTQPITVVLYTEESFQYATGAPHTVRGLFDGKIRIPVGGLEDIGPELEVVVAHELVHALIYAKAGPEVSRWLHEGLAQKLSTPVDRAVRHLHRQEAAGEPARLEPFSYAASHAFVEFLWETFSANRLTWLLEELARGRTENEAIERVFSTRLGELTERWRLWLELKD